VVEILNFKKGAALMKLNATVTNFNVWGILVSHCWRYKNMEYIHLTA
jgi:hypothetical protein